MSKFSWLVPTVPGNQRCFKILLRPNRTIRIFDGLPLTDSYGSARDNITLTPHNRREFDKSVRSYESRPDARWLDHHSGQRHEAVLFDLVANDNDRARSIAYHIDNRSPEEALRVSSESAAPFAQVNELLAIGTLTVSIENSKGEEILAQHGNGGEKFSIEKMSDGERSAVIMAAEVLTAKPSTVFLIDEPERHLHRAIIMPFLSALFKQRKDCDVRRLNARNYPAD